MRILSYNIHGCIGRDKIEDPKRIIKVIRTIDADIVGLQEVHHQDAQDRSFLRKLERLDYASILYGKTMRLPEADYGNLLLLRNPPSHVQRIELPAQGREPRGAMIADTIWEGNELRIIVTHLGLSRPEREQQLATIEKQLPATPSPVSCILLGDLNEWLPQRRYFRQFRQQFDFVSGLGTFPVQSGWFALDRIALRGAFRNARFSTINTPISATASDHRPLVCEVELSPSI